MYPVLAEGKKTLFNMPLVPVGTLVHWAPAEKGIVKSSRALKIFFMAVYFFLKNRFLYSYAPCIYWCLAGTFCFFTRSGSGNFQTVENFSFFFNSLLFFALINIGGVQKLWNTYTS